MLLFDRLPFRRPAPPPPPPSDQRLHNLMYQALERIPYYHQVRIFWHDLWDMRALWPVLLPLLGWIGWRTYRAEQRKVRQPASEICD